MAGGVRHRSAAVELGAALVAVGEMDNERLTVFSAARRAILAYPAAWTERLGALVVDNTLSDLSSVIDDTEEQAR